MLHYVICEAYIFLMFSKDILNNLIHSTNFKIILWVIIPSISLVIFLIIASHHLGKEDTQFLSLIHI